MRFRAAAAARKEYERIVTHERIALAARKPAPSATQRIYSPGEMMYVYREKTRQQTGPHMIASVYGKCARIHVGDKRGPREFNISLLRPAPLPSPLSDGAVEPHYQPMVLHTEVVNESDPRSSLFDQAKKRELQGLLDRGAFKICLREEAGDDPNIIPSRFVLAIKDNQSDNSPPILKAKFVLGGHKDRERHALPHDERTVRPESFRLLIALATTLRLRFLVADWKQGNIQSKSQLLRKIFICPKELNLAQDELVQVLLPVYCLPDSGEYWSDTLANHLREHCQFQRSATDLSFWLRTTTGKLLALAATYVDDIP